MDSETAILIQQLHQVINLLSTLKKEASLTKEDWKIFSLAEKYFGEKYFFKNNYSKFLKNLPISAVADYINALEKKEEEEEKEQKKPQEQDASIPPELEALVAEYRQNQALLESEEIKSNSQRSVALQVKIAIAHSKIRNLALANRKLRLSKGEKFQDLDNLLVFLGSPKSESKTAALAASYKAVQEVAFTHENFTKLSPEIQNGIITQAVELNTICVTNIDVAIQSAALLIDTSGLPPTDQKNVSDVSSNYIHSVYDAVNTQTQQAAVYETQIIENKIVLLKLEEESKPLKGKDLEVVRLQINSLSETNQQLTKKLDSLPHQFDIFVNNQLPDYQKFEDDSQTRLSKDPDTKDRIEIANKNIASTINNLENNGIKGHIPTPMDDAQLLEQAIRKDMPGVLLPYAGYEAEYAAALINHPKTQSPDLSPQAVLLYGKELTPTLLARVRQFASAKKNAGTALGKLFQARQEIFDSAGSQLRKIAASPLGKEISIATTGIKNVTSSISNYFQKLSQQPTGFGMALKPNTGFISKISQSSFAKGVSNLSTGIGETFKSVSGFFNKISDKIGAFSAVLGTVARVVQNPWRALRSWTGRKAGQLILKRIIQHLSNETLKKGAEMLLKNGLKGAVKKLVAEAVAKAAIKLGVKTATKLTLEAAAQATNVVPGLGLIIAVAIEVIWWVGEKTIGYAKKVFDNVSIALYGEKIKARDLIAIPAMGIATAVGGVITFLGALATATVAAASSAIGIIVAGSIIGIFFYITSIAVAPLLSTLVQLESAPRLTTVAPQGCANWPTAGEYLVLQGPLGVATHAKSSLQAIDIGAEESTGFLAAAPGEVIFSAPLGTYGNTVIVAANTNVGTINMLYAHMNSVNVSSGQSVNVGDEIGSVGGTGGWSPHIHFEYRDGIEYNSCPAGDIPVPEYCNGANCLYNGQLIYTNITTP